MKINNNFISLDGVYSLEAFASYTLINRAERTVDGYTKSIKNFFSCLQIHPSKIQRSDLTNYISKIINKISASWANSQYQAIKKYYEYLTDNKYFSKADYAELFYKVPLTKPKHTKQTVYLEDETKYILDFLEKESKNNNFTDLTSFVYILIAATTGGRANEIACIRIKDIDFSNLLLTFEETKNKEIRTLPLSKNVAKIIQDYIIKRNKISKCNSENLFLSRYGKEIKSNTLCANVKNIGKRYNRHIVLHAFRRGYATMLSNMGVPIEDISKILGHKSIEMTKRYIYNDERLIKAAQTYCPYDKKEDTILESIPTNNIVTDDLNILINNMFLNSNSNNNQNIMSYNNNINSSKKVEPVASGEQQSSSNSNFDFSNMLFLISNVANEMGKMYQSMNA